MASGGGIMSGTDRPAGSPLLPTFHGYIGSTMDALILFEACLTGHLFHVPRRPHDRERAGLIVSGNVFIYEEHSSGIKRWTDGVPWSPSRILGNFLLYRELDKPFQPGEKKRAMKRNKSEAGITKPAPTSSSRPSSNGNYSTAALMTAVGNPASGIDNATANRNDTERALVGSLIDSYQFKQDGLVKKTISVTYQGIQHHMVSYYKLDDVLASKLQTPSQDPALASITPRAPLISSGSFRAPVDDHEVMGGTSHFRGLMELTHQYGSYGMNGVGSVSRSMSMPSMQTYGPTSWASHAQYAAPYGMSQTLPPPSTYAPAPPYNYNQSSMMSYDMAPRSSVGSIGSVSSFAYHQPSLHHQPSVQHQPSIQHQPSVQHQPPMSQHQSLPARRQSMANGGTGVSSMEYSGLSNMDQKLPIDPAPLLSNGGGVGNHSASGQPAGASGGALAPGPTTTAPHPSQQRRNTYESSLTDRGELYDNSFDGGAAHQAQIGFSTSLPDQQVQNLDPSNQVDTPQNMQLNLEDSESTQDQMPDPDWPPNGFGDDNFPQ
ncbi:Gti1/Pac2 family-domain-containing protein [Hypomontagnella submonticulosa]|nr:Gti1/Pac2 family-domain-containing protein [Hypomontagnella submonticulosa]